MNTQTDDLSAKGEKRMEESRNDRSNLHNISQVSGRLRSRNTESQLLCPELNPDGPAQSGLLEDTSKTWWMKTSPIADGGRFLT